VFRVVFTRRLDKLEAVAARAEDDFDPEKNRRSERVMVHVYRLLETRGRAAAVDERTAAQMAAQGIAQDEIAEIAFMLDLMQRRNLAVEKRERLAALVEEVGGEPNPMNLALAQETVYRAFAEANFLSERRHDGVRVEIEKTIADDALQPRPTRWDNVRRRRKPTFPKRGALWINRPPTIRAMLRPTKIPGGRGACGI